MLFDDDQDSLANRLDFESLDKLTELFSARGEYLQAASQVQSMRAEQFKGSTHVDLEEINSFVEQVLVPRRDKVHRLMIELLGEAVDVEKIKSILPMIVAALATQIDIELILNIIGADVDAAMEGMELIREFISQ